MAESSPFRADLFGLWVAEDVSKSLLIAQNDEGETRVTVWKGMGEKSFATDRPATWTPADPKKLLSTYARERLGQILVELGTPSLGNTYHLMPACLNESGDVTTYGDFQWRPIDPDTPAEDVRLFPESGGSYFEALLGHWDDYVEDLRDAETHWVEPLSTYRLATPEQRAEHPHTKS